MAKNLKRSDLRKRLRAQALVVGAGRGAVMIGSGRGICVWHGLSQAPETGCRAGLGLSYN